MLVDLILTVPKQVRNDKWCCDGLYLIFYLEGESQFTLEVEMNYHFLTFG